MLSLPPVASWDGSFKRRGEHLMGDRLIPARLQLLVIPRLTKVEQLGFGVGKPNER